MAVTRISPTPESMQRGTHYIVVNMETKVVVGEVVVKGSEFPADVAKAQLGERKPNERMFVMLGSEPRWEDSE